MFKNDLEMSPVIIGGMGGSGTRVIAELCNEIGIFMGSDTNKASDNLLYTLLFRRKSWFKKMIQNRQSFSTALSLHHKMYHGRKNLSISEFSFLCYAVLDMSLHYRDDWRWPFRRVLAYLKQPSSILDNINNWGWKEPNTFLLIPELSKFYPSMKYIHTIRHGLDMAFSTNQRQVRAWGDLFGLPIQRPGQESPAVSFSYWIESNKKANEEGRKLGRNNYFLLNFDTLCMNPINSIKNLAQFLEINLDYSQIRTFAKIPKIPQSLGRYKSRDLSAFSFADFGALDDFGFEFTIE